MELFNTLGKKVKNYFYPPTSLRLPSEQEIVTNSKRVPLPAKPAPSLRPQSDYRADYKGPRDVAYTMESIKRPEDLYVEQYGKYKEIGEQNLRGAMAARRKAMYNLLQKYPQSRFADKNVDQQILNSRFLPVVDPAFGQKEADYIRDYYRAGGDYSRPVAIVQSHRRVPVGLAHVVPWYGDPVKTVTDKLFTKRRLIFPGIEEQRLPAQVSMGDVIVNPTGDAMYGQSVLTHYDADITAAGIKDVMHGVDIGYYPTEKEARKAKLHRYDPRLGTRVRARNIVKPTKRHELGHAGAPYFNLLSHSYPLFGGLRMSAVAPTTVVQENDKNINAFLDKTIGKGGNGLFPQGLRRSITDLSIALGPSGYRRGAYFNNPAEAMTTFNQWKSNYARETGKLSPASLEELIGAERRRGAIKGTTGSYKTVPSVMYSTGHTNDWASGIDGILSIRNDVHRAVTEGRITKEEAEAIYKRMNELFLQGNRGSAGTSLTVGGYEHA